MVLEDADNWYAEDGALSRQLCELVEPDNGKKGKDEEGMEDQNMFIII
jgi:hypothetical protein